MSPNRRQSIKYHENIKGKSISLSLFIIVMFIVVSIFTIILTTTILNYEKKVSELINSQVTDITLIPGINNTESDSSFGNLTLID